MKQNVMKVYGKIKVGYSPCIFNFGLGWRWPGQFASEERALDFLDRGAGIILQPTRLL